MNNILKIIKLNTRIKILMSVLSVLIIAVVYFNFSNTKTPVSSTKKVYPTKKQEDISVIIEKAEALFLQNHKDESLSLYKSVLDKNINNAKLHNDIGYILLEKNFFSDSERHLVLAVKLDPACSECNNNLGILRTRQGKMLEAEKYFKEAIILNETFPEPYYNLGVLYEKNGDIGSAINFYNNFMRHCSDKDSVVFLQVENRVLMLVGK